MRRPTPFSEFPEDCLLLNSDTARRRDGASTFILVGCIYVQCQEVKKLSRSASPSEPRAVHRSPRLIALRPKPSCEVWPRSSVVSRKWHRWSCSSFSSVRLGNSFSVSVKRMLPLIPKAKRLAPGGRSDANVARRAALRRRLVCPHASTRGRVLRCPVAASWARTGGRIPGRLRLSADRPA